MFSRMFPQTTQLVTRSVLSFERTSVGVTNQKLVIFNQVNHRCAAGGVLNLAANSFSTTSSSCAKRWKDKNKQAFEEEFLNPVRDVAGLAVNPEKGIMYDKKPFKLRVEKYNEYIWCGCGYGKTCQPLCDKSCENLWLKKIIKGGPVRYIAPETKDVWFCNCKQTGNRPFCDGTHRSEEVQQARMEYNREVWEPKGKL